MSTPLTSRPKAIENLRHASLVLGCFTALYIVFFSPVLFSGHLLASGDAVLYYLPNLYSPLTTWDPMILSGFPTMADPQVMAWYPLATLFSWLKSYNGFLISAYVLASCFSYGYIYSLTHSRVAGAVAGITYGLCGFMFAHLGHAAIVHAAAWLPLIFWALESLRRDLRPFWLVIGSFGVACCFLAGHPQIFVYAMYLSAAYILTQGWNAPVGRLRYYLAASLVMVLGVGLTAIQLLPTLELAGLSVREKLTFPVFVSYALPLEQIPALLFPNMFGGSTMPGASATYFGRWNVAEITGYVGLLPLALALVGVISDKRRTLVIFWIGVAVLAFLLALGELTPLAQITYHVPAINKFRAPARHFIELALAVSVLSGMGIAALARREVTIRKLLIAVSATFAATALGLLSLALFRSSLEKFLRVQGQAMIDLRPWQNPTLGVPLLVFLAGAGFLFYWCRKPDSAHRRLLLLAILIVDLGTFSWFSYWRESVMTPQHLLPPVTAQRYGPILRTNLQRMLPKRGILGSFQELMPNISRLWQVPSVSTHGVFALTRYCEMTSMRSDGGGAFEDQALFPEDQSMNLLAVRYLFMPPPKAATPRKVQRLGTSTVEWLKTSGAGWPTADIDVSIGTACGLNSPGPIKLDLPEPILATKIGVGSWLGCATDIADGTKVAQITVTDTDNKSSVLDLVAGRDTSEWSYDCGNPPPQIKHKRATVLSSFPAEVSKSSCEGHRYEAMLPLIKETKIASIQVQWLDHPGVLALRKLALIHEPTQVSHFLQPSTEPFIDETRWRHVEDVEGISVYENLRAMPRVWLVPEVLSLDSGEILAAIKTSRLPDGRVFDPAQTGLVGPDDVRLAFSSALVDPYASAQVISMSKTRMTIQTAATSDTFLLASEIYYPGWEATLDGQPAKLVQSNYLLRGVAVPSGNHLVRFVFKPKMMYYGGAITGVSIVSLLLLFAAPRVKAYRNRRTAVSDKVTKAR